MAESKEIKIPGHFEAVLNAGLNKLLDEESEDHDKALKAAMGDDVNAAINVALRNKGYSVSLEGDWEDKGSAVSPKNLLLVVTDHYRPAVEVKVDVEIEALEAPEAPAAKGLEADIEYVKNVLERIEDGRDVTLYEGIAEEFLRKDVPLAKINNPEFSLKQYGKTLDRFAARSSELAERMFEEGTYSELSRELDQPGVVKYFETVVNIEESLADVEKDLAKAVAEAPTEAKAADAEDAKEAKETHEELVTKLTEARDKLSVAYDAHIDLEGAGRELLAELKAEMVAGYDQVAKDELEKLATEHETALETQAGNYETKLGDQADTYKISRRRVGIVSALAGATVLTLACWAGGAYDSDAVNEGLQTDNADLNRITLQQKETIDVLEPLADHTRAIQAGYGVSLLAAKSRDKAGTVIDEYVTEFGTGGVLELENGKSSLYEQLGISQDSVGYDKLEARMQVWEVTDETNALDTN